MRTQLLAAASAVALFAAPALAQEAPINDPIDPPSNTTDAQPPATTPADPVTPTAPTGVEAEAEVTASADNTIVDVLRAQGNFTTLVQALEATGLDDVLANDDSITILAPTDEAFAALPPAERQRLMDPANREGLQRLLLYHVINADVRRGQIENRRGPVETGSGAQILLNGVGGLRADAATITNADLRGSNGAVLVVDQVLNPETSQAGMGDVDDTATDQDAATTDQPATASTDDAADTTTNETVATDQPATTTDPAVTDAGDDEATPPTTDDEGAAMPTTPPTDTPPADPVDPGDEDPTTPDPQ